MTGPGFYEAQGPLHLRARAVVVGSGAGGAAVADQLAQAGWDVVVLEMGRRELPTSFTQREEQMLPRLFQEAGARTTLDLGISVLQGQGVGGSTLHNLNLCKRVEPELLARWAQDQALPELPAALGAAYDAVERDLAVSRVLDEQVNLHNRLFERGCAALGWASARLHHNRVGCAGQGYCELGCTLDAKMNAARVLLPRAVAHGARVVARVRVERVRFAWGRACGVEGRTADGAPARVDAECVVLAASATGSPALLLASGVQDPHQQLGAHLHLHPAVNVGGVFAEEVHAWRGVPQSVECTEHLHPTDPARRVWLLPISGHPALTAAQTPGLGAAHATRMRDYPRLGAVTAMLHDYGWGRVGADRAGRPRLRYSLRADDAAALGQGALHAARVLLAAGATEVTLPWARPLVLRTLADCDRAAPPLRLLDPPLAAVHPMGSLRLAGDPRRGACDPWGRLYAAQGVWVADGSLMPSSTGGPPQLSIYALGRLVGQALAAGA